MPDPGDFNTFQTQPTTAPGNRERHFLSSETAMPRNWASDESKATRSPLIVFPALLGRSMQAWKRIRCSSSAMRSRHSTPLVGLGRGVPRGPQWNGKVFFKRSSRQSTHQRIPVCEEIPKRRRTPRLVTAARRWFSEVRSYLANAAVSLLCPLSSQ